MNSAASPPLGQPVFTTLPQLFDAAISRHGSRTAFASEAGCLTYQALGEHADALAAYLQQHTGIVKGDRVAVMLPNILAFPIALLALARLGAVQVNVNPLYTAHELEHQLRDAGVRTAIVFDQSLETLRQVAGSVVLQRVLVADAAAGSEQPNDDAALSPLGDVVLHSFSNALRQGARLHLQPTLVDADDVMFLQYTGGTTGLSKGATLSHANVTANVAQFSAAIPKALRSGQERILTALPLYHIFALTVNLLTYSSIGAINWLVANPRDLDRLIAVLAEFRPTVFVGVNTLYSGVLGHRDIAQVDFSDLNFSIGGGAAILDVTSQAWRRLTGVMIHQGYGLSETSPVLSFTPSNVDFFNGSVGLPLPLTDILILDENDNPVSDGDTGEICAKGPQVMRGYWNNAEADLQAFTPDGYFRTGDIGHFDEDGFLHVVDRKKDMINVSGLKVYPNEVEAVATTFPGIRECACAGVMVDGVETVGLFVVTAPAAQLDVKELEDYLRLSLSPYKIPRRITVMQALPKSTVGKILRRELRTPSPSAPAI